MTERVERILPRLMRDLGEQLRHQPQCNSLGIGANTGWLVVRLSGGRFAVGSFGGAPPSVEEVQKAIRDFQTQGTPVANFGCVGM